MILCKIGNLLPFIEYPNNYFGRCSPVFWGFDTRTIGEEEITGFFVDVEEYDEKTSVSIYFAPPIYGIRWTDENIRLASGCELRKTQSSLKQSLVYSVTNSDFIGWFEQETDGLYGENVRHFSVVATDDIIDILCVKEPVIV